MVKKILGIFGKEIKGLHEAAYILAAFVFFSQILGLFRDRLLASQFGAGEIVDLYYASFRIPDLLFVAITSFISASVLIPVFSAKINNKVELQKIVNSLFTFFIISAVLICILVFIFAPFFLKFLIPGIFNGQYSNELVLFTRIMLLSPLLLGISQLFGSIVQVYRRFFIYAISPILYNAGIIIGILFLYPMFEIIGLIYGVILGLILHIIIQIPAIVKHDLVPKLSFTIDWNEIRHILKISLPRAVTLGSTQLILLFFVYLASSMATGSISVLNFAYNLQGVPLAIIGISYSMAAFPTLSKLYASGDKEEFLGHLITSARHIIFWSIPVIVMFVVLRAQIVRTIFGFGEFDWQDTRLTAAALAIFSVSVLGQSLILLFVRAYYSTGQTKKPLYINIISTIFIIISSLILLKLFSSFEKFKLFFEKIIRVSDVSDTTILMLPVAFSFGLILNLILLWIHFENDFKGFSKSLSKTFNQSCIASLLAGIASYIMLDVFDNFFNLKTVEGVFLQGFFAGIIGICIWALFLYIVKNYEFNEVIKTFHKRFWRNSAQSEIVLDQE